MSWHDSIFGDVDSLSRGGGGAGGAGTASKSHEQRMAESLPLSIGGRRAAGIEEMLERFRSNNKTLMHKLYSLGVNEIEKDRASEVRMVPTRAVVEGELNQCWVIKGHHAMSLTDPQSTIHNEGLDVMFYANGWEGDMRDEEASLQSCQFVVRGETNFLSIERCTNCIVALDSVMEAVLIVDCSNVIVMLGSDVPPVTVKDSVGVEIVMGKQKRRDEVPIETKNSCGCFLSIVEAKADPILANELLLSRKRNADMIPDHMITTIDNGAIFTVCKTEEATLNQAHVLMATNYNIMPNEL
uniref:Adenylate cyclase-associated CAP C-terminal domain-containing protein n=1 Tax=Hanusia phi TaxID=3032 RepID=A0A7S0DWS7_9CRYP|mmetsp:Transcript_11881/g.27444  ORF Transcript_11881/g.27444 Transcript_11881/m.27444 type:complete len:298 (+) Transcript_11881:244-1137(+)